MSILFKISSIISLIIFLSGCMNKDIMIPKKPILKKDIKKVKKIDKRPVYKYCSKHKKIMNYANNYIKNEFDKGYFLQKDVIGAKAQIFLIENHSPSIFAKNINKAQKSYKLQYEIAKKNGCNIDKFKIYPISKIKINIKLLEKNNVL